jgi:hypothetical protein
MALTWFSRIACKARLTPSGIRIGFPSRRLFLENIIVHVRCERGFWELWITQSRSGALDLFNLFNPFNTFSVEFLQS